MGQLTDDVLKWTLDINGDPARKELTEVGNTTNKLERDNRALSTEMAKLEAHGKKGSDEWKKYESQIKANDTAILGNKKRMEELRKEVGLNNLSSVELRKEMKNLKAQMDRTDPNSKQWKEMNLEFSTMQGRLSQIRGGVTSVDGVFGKFKQTAGALLPAFGFAAIAAGAKYVFDKIIAGTDAMADKYEFAMAGMKNGTDYFWKTLASGEWENFFSNFREAVKVGYQYSKMLDSVEEKTRSLSMVESDARAEELRLEEAVKNKLLSKDERIKAGEDRIKLEKTLSAKRTQIANEGFEAEISLSSQRTGLSKEQLIQITKNIDSEAKVKADAYNEQKDQLKKLQAANETTVNSPYGSVYVPTYDTDEIIKLKKEIASTPDSVKAYAGAINQYGNLTKDMMDRIAESYNKKNQAEDSAIENTKKVRNLVHTLMAGQDAEGQKLTVNKTKEELDNTTKALDLGYKQQQLLLKQKYATEETMQKEYQARMLATEIAYMQTKLQITTGENERVDLQSQIIDKQVAYTAALKEAVPEIINTDNAVAKLNTRLLEESKLLDFAAQKQAKGASDQADYTAKQMQQAETIKMAGDIMTDYVTGAIDGSMDEFQSFGDTLILMSLQMLKMMVPIWSAQILGLSLASPESVATWGVAGMAKFAIVSGLMYAGISAVEGLVKGGISKKREAAGNTVKHAVGGFTQGETTYIAGESGQEWIAPHWMLKDPIAGGIIRNMENFRETKNAFLPFNYVAPNLYIPPVIPNINPVIPNTNPVQFIPPNTDTIITSDQSGRLNEILERLEKWKPFIDIETYERKREVWKKTTTGGLK